MRFHGYPSVDEWIRVAETLDGGHEYRVRTEEYRKISSFLEFSTETCKALRQVPYGEQHTDITKAPELVWVMKAELPSRSHNVFSFSWYMMAPEYRELYAHGDSRNLEEVMRTLGFAPTGRVVYESV